MFDFTSTCTFDAWVHLISDILRLLLKTQDDFHFKLYLNTKSLLLLKWLLPTLYNTEYKYSLYSLLVFE